MTNIRFNLKENVHGSIVHLVQGMNQSSIWSSTNHLINVKDSIFDLIWGSARASSREILVRIDINLHEKLKNKLNNHKRN